MHGHYEFEAARGRRMELLREAEEARLGRTVRLARRAEQRGREEEVLDLGVVVRWAHAGDEGTISELLVLNGAPRWVAFEGRFVVAEEGGRIVAVLRYRTEARRLVLGLLVADPWAGERRLASALYRGAAELASGLCVDEVIARPAAHEREYARAAGYVRGLDGWRAGGSAGGEARRSRSLHGLWEALRVPFGREFRG